MNQIVEYLEQLDLSESEAELYVKLLETGPVRVRELAKATKMKRTTVYLYVDQLVEKGLIMKLVKGSQKLIAANQPQETLENLVEKKVQSAKTIQNNFTTIVKKINTTFPQTKHNEDAEIKYYKGIKAVRKIYDEAFSGKEFRSYVKVEDQPVLSSDNPNLYGNAFDNNKDLKVWEIMYDSPTSRRQAFKLLSESNNYFYKFMPPDLKWSITSEDILIFDGKVAIISYKGTISSTVLQSADFYNNSKELFDFIWRMIPEQNS